VREPRRLNMNEPSRSILNGSFASNDGYCRRFVLRHLRFEWGRWHYLRGTDGIDEWWWEPAPPAPRERSEHGKETK
jgi:hypothetical protein